MAYEFLRKLFGTPKDGEQAKSMTYEELEAAIDAAKDIQVIDLKAGGYVDKGKLDGKITELDGVKQQLEDANKEIASYREKDMDLEKVQKSATEWETKYKEETKKLQTQLKDQQRQFADDKFLSNYQFVDDFARAGVLAEFRSKEFKYDEANGTFLGAEEYMKGIMESHKNAFVIPDADPDGNGEGDNGGGTGGGQNQQNQNTKQKPNFLGQPGNQGGGTGGGESNPFGFHFTGVRPNPNVQK